jgi:D-citramalate synthase
MDTTLRDGEQTPQLAFSPAEKLIVARALLLDVGVDRVEVASCHVSPGEREAAERILRWARGAGCLQRVEVLGFCDGGRSADWLADAGGLRMNLLAKGSETHCRRQLGRTPEAHFGDVEAAVGEARARGLQVGGVYLEDWSRGLQESPDYVMALTARLRALGVERIYLADTLGCLAPDQVTRLVDHMVRAFPGQCFELHGHDDYGLATANALAAVRAGARGVHTCVNGLGERAGNARLAEVVLALHDHAGVRTGVCEAQLPEISSRVETASGKPVAHNAPIVGRDVFTQTAGVHADGDRKGGLYETRLRPERLGRTRSYALGKHAGRASLEQNLDRLGVVLTRAERERLLSRVVALGDAKRPLHPDELPALLEALRSEDDQRPGVAAATAGRT